MVSLIVVSALLGPAVSVSAQSGSTSAVRSSDYHRVTIELSDEGGQTRLSLTEQGNKTERELAHSEGGWRMALGNMKALLEGTSIVPMR